MTYYEFQALRTGDATSFWHLLPYQPILKEIAQYPADGYSVVEYELV